MICGFSLKKNMLVSYADDALLIAHIPSPNMRFVVNESLNRDQVKSVHSVLYGV